ncbi:MAG: hypothetical protein JWO82_3365, partial [Akkermansiaceae bacterium]|nr:hypothetical protein [Akkermansiaceae bacterium]
TRASKFEVAASKEMSGQDPEKRSADPKLSAREEYRRAWELLSRERMTADERMSSQQQILKGWAEVDLEGAVKAALAESWQPPPGWNGDMDYWRERAFWPVFRKQPLESWQAIEKADLGVGKYLMEKAWVGGVACDDPKLAISMLEELPDTLKTTAISLAVPRTANEQERLEMLQKIAAGSPDETTMLSRLQTAYAALPPQSAGSGELRGKWESLPEGPERTMALVAWGSTLRETSAEAFGREWAEVPEGQRKEAARVALSQLNASSPAFTQAIDQVVAAGDWDYLNHSPVLSFWPMSTGAAGTKKFADWALTLPAQPEAAELFRRAAGNFIFHDRQESEGWLAAMPAGDWHRDQGYVELTESAAWFGERELAQRAIAAVTDPALRAEAQAEYDRALRRDGK